MDMHPVLDRQTALDRLLRPMPQISMNEEKVHSWQARLFQSFDEPLLRVWDKISGSQPEQDGRMISRAPEMRLDDRESRRTSLFIHSDYRKWEPTPYISFTTSESRIESLVKMRANRGPHMLTVIDPNIRLQNGLPIIHAKAEMDYYDIPDPYRRNHEYYFDEYLCLWQVTEAEIVGHWDWGSLKDDDKWYHNTILPAFRSFTARMATNKAKGLLLESPMIQPAKDSIDDLQSSFAKLTTTCGPPNYPNSEEWNEEFNDRRDSDEEDECDTDDEEEEDGGFHHDGFLFRDSDDDAEEANVADNVIRFIEENWI